FIRVPGETPKKCPQSVSHIDFLPTLLDLLGKSAPSQCAGQSRANLVRGESSPSDFIFLRWAPTKVDVAIKHSTLASKQQIHACLNESTRAVVSPYGWKLCLRDKRQERTLQSARRPRRTSQFVLRQRASGCDRRSLEKNPWLASES